MGKMTFRTIFGGPGMPSDYYQALTDIESNLSNVEFAFTYDLSLTIGGDLVEFTHPTGLRNPRVSVSDLTAKGSIFLNNQDIAATDDHRKLLREVVHKSSIELIDRVSKKVADFDSTVEKEKLGFLLIS